MFHSQIIAAPDPTSFNEPRFISWPSVCDTARVNWLGLEPPDPATPSPAIENHVQYAIMFDPCTDQPIDPRVLAGCSSIDCVAPPVVSSLTFTATATPPAVSSQLYSSVICAPDVALPTAPESESKRAHASRSDMPKKRGRRSLFDEVRRAELLGMVKSGCTIRYAARRVGVNHATVVKASNRDPMFADRLARAQQERDILSVRRIQNAGEKSWRAAAWLLERNEPKEFSLGHKTRDPWTVRGQRRLKTFVTNIVHNVLIDCIELRSNKPKGDPSSPTDHRLAEIEAQLRGCNAPQDDEIDLDDSAGDILDGESPCADSDEQEYKSDGQEDSDGDNAAAADRAYERLCKLLGR